MAIILPAWVFVAFALAQLLIVGVLLLLRSAGVAISIVSETVLNTIVAAAVYLISLALVIGVPWFVRRYRTTTKELGLHRLASWMDILLAPAGFIVYLLISSTLVYVIGQLLPNFDPGQTQEVGFSHLVRQYEYLLAFVTLVVIAPIAEETLFRGYLYGKLRQYVPVWIAMLTTSLLFGLLHGQLNVGIDVFALSIVLCSLRELTGSIWAGILLHMMKNGLAFYLLFINTTLLHTIGG